MRIKLLGCLVAIVITIASIVSTEAQQDLCPLPTLASGNPSEPSATPVPEVAIANGEKVEFYISKCSTQVTEYTFSGQAGDVFTILLRSSTIGNGLACAALFSETGENLAQAIPVYSADGYSASAISYFILSTSGKYKVLIQPCDNNGYYSIRVIKTEIKPIAFDTVVEENFDPIQHSIAFSFAGQANDEIYLKSDSLQSPVQISFYCKVREACGNANTGSSIGNINTAAIFNQFPTRLPLTGQYLMTINSRSETSALRFIISRLKPIPIQYGDTLEAVFGVNTPIRAYRFVGQIGDRLQMHVDSHGEVDTALSVVKDSSLLQSDDDGGFNDDPEITNWSLTEDGTYLIIIQTVEMGDQGRVTFHFDSSHIELDDKPQVVSVSTKHQPIVMTFDGKAKQQYAINTSYISTNVSAAQISIRQNDTYLVQSQQLGGNGSSVKFVVPFDGKVSVLISPNGALRSTIEVSLTHLNE